MVETVRRFSTHLGFLATIRIAAACGLVPVAVAGVGSSEGESVPAAFSGDRRWDDGLSEMSYYDAVETIYGVERSYTRVHLMNRQWMGSESGVKAEPDDPGAVPVFKFVIAEEIPTENYNYRYLTTVFLHRAGLFPFKLSVSSQEWCGHTFKQLRWNDDGLIVRSFSYFPDEGDRTWQINAGCVPHEGLFVLARAAVAGQAAPAELPVLPTLRSNHQIEPTPTPGRLRVEDRTRRITVALGSFTARRVSLQWSGPATWFDVESVAPWRVLAFENGTARGALRFVERRAYWDRNWESGFYRAGRAP